MTVDEFEKLIAEVQYKWVIRKYEKNWCSDYDTIKVAFYNLYGEEQHLLNFYYNVNKTKDRPSFNF